MSIPVSSPPRHRPLSIIVAAALFPSLLAPPTVLARPIVRNIKSTHEFDALLKKHSTETGFPVVADFYSDGCGPCRMIAPIFRQLAEQNKGKAVYVKVDMNRQHELAQRYQVRSMPTFVFLVGGKVVNQFSGAGEGQLRQFSHSAIAQAEEENVVLTEESLIAYYKEKDPEKDEYSVREIIQKCAGLIKNNKTDKCYGRPAFNLGRKLRKKYKVMPDFDKRFTPENADANTEEQKEKSRSKSKSDEPNLHLATMEQLEEELQKRLDEILEAENEAAVDDDAEFQHSWTPSDFPERVVIVGGGPAGLSAAIYAARAGLVPLVIAPPIGGQLQGKGVDVENFPGIHMDTGPGIVAKMREQAVEFGALFEADMVVKVDASSKPIKVFTEGGTKVETHTVIVASGADSKWLGIPGEYDMRGGGVSSCATCDGAAFFGKDVIVVGGGDTAMEDALVLARTSQSVSVVHRRDSFRASSILAQRVITHKKITVLWNTTVNEILGEDAPLVEGIETSDAPPRKIVTGAVLNDIVTGKETILPVQAVFVAIGHMPHTSFLEGVVDFQEGHAGYVKTKAESTWTSVEGIFASGDVSDPIYRQAVTSAGSGAAAALDAERYLSEYGLGNEAAEFEAELLREMMEDLPSREGEYNAYEEESNRGKGMKESMAADKEQTNDTAEERRMESNKAGTDEDHIEL